VRDSDWLAQVFEQAQRDYNELPDWARPVFTPPVAGAGSRPPSASADDDLQPEAGSAHIIEIVPEMAKSDEQLSLKTANLAVPDQNLRKFLTIGAG
jgi:hypothetical protein